MILDRQKCQEYTRKLDQRLGRVMSVVSAGQPFFPVRSMNGSRVVWDDFQTYKTCLFCVKVRDQARKDFDLSYDEGFPFEQLWECVGMDYGVN